MRRNTEPTIANLGRLALEYVKAMESSGMCKHILSVGYLAWRECTGNRHTEIERGSKEWNAMMAATADEYKELQKAKARERRLKAKLLWLGSKVEG